MPYVEWNAPGLYYLLKYRPLPHGQFGDPEKITDPKVNTFAIPNPGYYKPWEFQIQAGNDQGMGPTSPLVQSYSGQDPPKGAPGNVKVGAVTARTAQLSWKPINVTRGSVDGYRIYYWGESRLGVTARRRREIPGHALFVDVPGGGTTSYTVINLTPYTNYNLSIRAYNSGGEGPASTKIAFPTDEATSINFRWCATPKEQTKCQEFIKYANMTAQNKTLTMGALSCVQGKDYDDCATKIQAGDADLVTLDGGRVYAAGKDKGLIPIVSEQYGKYGVKYYAVAIVKESNRGFNLKTLKGRKSCHTGARRIAGWNVPIGYLLRTKIIPPVKCDTEFHDFYSAAAFFNESCVSGMSKYNVAKEVHDKLCALCNGTGADKCSSDYNKNRYSGYHGAFMCMAEEKGDVAFAKHTTVEEVVGKGNYGAKTDYQYLCKDGSRKEVGEHEKCHLGFNPAHAVVTRKDNKYIDDTVTLLTAMSSMYGPSQTDWNKFQLFNSSKYGGDGRNLLFKDSSTALVSIAKDKRTYEGYLGEEYVKDTVALKKCESGTAENPTAASTKTVAHAFMLLAAVLLTVLGL